MSYWILPSSGVPESRTTVQRVTLPESSAEANISRFNAYDRKIAERYKESRLYKSGDKPNPDEYHDLISEDEDFAEEFNRTFSNDDINEDDFNHTP